VLKVSSIAELHALYEFKPLGGGIYKSSHHLWELRSNPEGDGYVLARLRPEEDPDAMPRTAEVQWDALVGLDIRLAGPVLAKRDLILGPSVELQEGDVLNVVGIENANVMLHGEMGNIAMSVNTFQKAVDEGYILRVDDAEAEDMPLELTAAFDDDEPDDKSDDDDVKFKVMILNDDGEVEDEIELCGIDEILELLTTSLLPLEPEDESDDDDEKIKEARFIEIPLMTAEGQLVIEGPRELVEDIKAWGRVARRFYAQRQDLSPGDSVTAITRFQTAHGDVRADDQGEVYQINGDTVWINFERSGLHPVKGNGLRAVVPHGFEGFRDDGFADTFVSKPREVTVDARPRPRAKSPLHKRPIITGEPREELLHGESGNRYQLTTGVPKTPARR